MRNNMIIASIRVIGFLVILVVQMRRLYLVRIPLWNVFMDRQIDF